VSIAAMADNRVLRSPSAPVPLPGGAPPGPQALGPPVPGPAAAPAPAGVPSDVLSNLTLWIPAETLTAYVGAQALLGNITVPPGKKLYEADFTTRWVIFVSALVITPVLVGLYTKIKARTAQRAFKWPIAEMILASISFVLWAIALPDTPANNFEGWQAWWGGAAILFITPLIALGATAFGFTPDFSKVS
jgi:hypothetical protein